MRPFAARRAGLIFTLLLCSVATLVGWYALDNALRPVGIYTGLLLFALVLALTLFNARKKLPFLPLLKASTWLQIHIYLGWFCLLVFLIHIHFRLPRGVLEITLASVFCLVTASGVFGLYLSRWLPGRMKRSGEPLLYESMPAYRQRIRQAAESLIRQAETETSSSTLADFYFRRLRPFFAGSPGVAHALTNRERPLHVLLSELKVLARYFNSREQEIAEQLRHWIEEKHNLDFQYASQRLLKLWLFVHIPFSYVLILLGAVHGAFALLYAAPQ